MVVSVIIPIYNSEKHLEECIQSILEQDFHDFELLLINDGSLDSSGEVCDRYAASDLRVKVFHKPNGGVSSARNYGIDNAKGEWITFIDADDYVNSTYFNAIIGNVSQDIILQGFTYIEDGIIIKKHRYDDEVINQNLFLSKYRLYPDFSSACAKFFKRFIIEKNEIRFSNQLTFGEDTLFNLKYLKYCYNILMLSTTPYQYKITNTGLSNTKSNYLQDKFFYEQSKKELESFDNNRFYYESIKISLSRFLHALYNTDVNIDIKERKQELKKIIEKNYKVIFDIYTNPKIKLIIFTAYYTKLYCILDFVFKKINQSRK